MLTTMEVAGSTDKREMQSKLILVGTMVAVMAD
jgi:hypothetical protein